MNTTSILLSILFCALSCSSPLDQKYSRDTVKQDLELLSHSLDPGEYDLLVKTVILFSLEDRNLETLTYKQILREGKRRKQHRKISSEDFTAELNY